MLHEVQALYTNHPKYTNHPTRQTQGSFDLSGDSALSDCICPPLVQLHPVPAFLKLARECMLELGRRLTEPVTACGISQAVSK